jgi:hypothetical protein
MSDLTKTIAGILRSVLTDRAQLTDINALVKYAHHLAITRLRQLISSGRLHLQLFPLTLESTAIDCIAELFERDTDGRFIELKEFFVGPRSVELISDDKAVVYFHSLVFSKLRDGLFWL